MLGAHPPVKDVAVIGVPTRSGAKRVHAVVVLHDDGRRRAEAELIDWCRDRLAGFKRPRSVPSSPTQTCRAPPPARSCTACCARSLPVRDADADQVWVFYFRYFLHRVAQRLEGLIRRVVAELCQFGDLFFVGFSG